MIKLFHNNINAKYDLSRFSRLFRWGLTLGDSRDEAVAIFVKELKCFCHRFRTGISAVIHHGNEFVKAYRPVSFFILEKGNKYNVMFVVLTGDTLSKGGAIIIAGNETMVRNTEQGKY